MSFTSYNALDSAPLPCLTATSGCANLPFPSVDYCISHFRPGLCCVVRANALKKLIPLPEVRTSQGQGGITPRSLIEAILRRAKVVWVMTRGLAGVVLFDLGSGSELSAPPVALPPLAAQRPGYASRSVEDADEQGGFRRSAAPGGMMRRLCLKAEGDKSSSGKSGEWLKEKFQTSRQRKG